MTCKSSSDETTSYFFTYIFSLQFLLYVTGYSSLLTTGSLIYAIIVTLTLTLEARFTLKIEFFVRVRSDGINVKCELYVRLLLAEERTGIYITDEARYDEIIRTILTLFE